MKKYIERAVAIERARNELDLINKSHWSADEIVDFLKKLPAADVVEEENILKFYYVRSIDEYWIGQRIDNFYYAEYDPKSRQWVWTHSRYLPWGEHVVSPTSLWKEHTYPSEPEEIPFAEWLQGFIKKHAADVVEVRHGRWVGRGSIADPYIKCSLCGQEKPILLGNFKFNYCPNCGAKMDGGVNDGRD